MSSVWRSLEKDFRDIPDAFGDLRADWSHQPNIPNHWRLAAGSSRGVRDRFEAVARLAGKELDSTVGIDRTVSEQILAESDSLRRWLSAVRELTGHFEVLPTGTLHDASGALAGHLLMGRIPRVIEASALACLQLAANAVPGGVGPPPNARVFVDEIDSFANVRVIDQKDVLPLLSKGRLEVEEDHIQACLEAALHVPLHKKDWGGEENDLYTANLLIDGRRVATAFMLKGRGLRAATLQLAHCGKNGDQIVRLFQSPAELFVVQFIGMIGESVVKDIQGKTQVLVSQGRTARYCVIDGQDTARIVRAYGKT